jgi:hypothetical protein
MTAAQTKTGTAGPGTPTISGMLETVHGMMETPGAEGMLTTVGCYQ